MRFRNKIRKFKAIARLVTLGECIKITTLVDLANEKGIYITRQWISANMIGDFFEYIRDKKGKRVIKRIW